MVACVIFSGSKTPASASSRGSGTFAIPWRASSRTHSGLLVHTRQDRKEGCFAYHRQANDRCFHFSERNFDEIQNIL